MKVVAIGNDSFDLQIGCFGTLAKYVKNGNEAHLIIVGNKQRWTKKAVKEIKESSKVIGASETYFAKRFDYSRVTQDNVNALRLIIESINPDVVIMPSPSSINTKQKILGRSSLLACKKIKNILMYETEKSKNFLPVIYSTITNEVHLKLSSLSVYSLKNSIKNDVLKKIKLLHRYYADKAGIKTVVEAFETHRILLLNKNAF